MDTKTMLKITKKLINEIEKTKVTLKDRAKKEGIYENFGQREHRKLVDKYLDGSDYGFIMQERRYLLDTFFQWCVNYSPIEFKEVK